VYLATTSMLDAILGHHDEATTDANRYY